MDRETIILIAIGLILISAHIVLRIWLNTKDKQNILRASHYNGWADVSIKWTPFAPGWFFEKGERHYLVSYKDKDGKARNKYCKTSLLTGIYWRDNYS